MQRPKEDRLNSKAYLKWVASLDCMGCGISGHSQAAHSNQAKHGKGMARKASDLFTFPLCAPHWGMPGCHFLHDQCAGISKSARDALEDVYIARTHEKARIAERIEIR